MLNIMKPSKVCTFTKKKAKHCNHDGAEQESLSEQERFVQMKITFTLRKNWVVARFLWSGRLAGRQADKNLVD